MSTTLSPKYGSSAAVSSPNLPSLPSDSSLLAGWSSGVIDNTSNLSDSESLSFVIKTGTSPNVGTNIYIYIWAALDDTPTYPDVITGIESTKTLTSANVRDSGAFRCGYVMTVDATSNRLYYATVNIAALFGGHMPKKYGAFIVHNTGANLNASGNVVSRCDVTQYQNV